MKMKIPSLGALRGRVVAEALVGGPPTVPVERRVARSRPASNGYSTVLVYQVAERRRYLDEACFATGRTCD
jgi:hypothetical protein